MALNETKYLRTELSRIDLAETLIGLGQSIKDYLLYPFPEEKSLDCFFQKFNEGHKELQPTTFFAQTKLRKGRVGIGYDFKSADARRGELRIAVFDNGENIPQNHFDAVYSALKQYVCQRGSTILEEAVKPEY